MIVRATGTIKFDTWDERPYDEISRESRLSRAVVTNQYCGDIDGHARLEYLMFYSNANTIRFVGLERIVGHIGSKSGGFVLQHVGVFQESRSESVLSVLPHSGTGGLRDSVVDCLPATLKNHTATGFVFTPLDAATLLENCRRAVATYHDKRIWRQLQKNGMQRDFSWEARAQQYLDLYRGLPVG